MYIYMSISNVYTIMYIYIYKYICMLYIYHVYVDKNIYKSITGRSKMLQRV